VEFRKADELLIYWGKPWRFLQTCIITLKTLTTSESSIDEYIYCIFKVLTEAVKK
jgi:hypothetical protein